MKRMSLLTLLSLFFLSPAYPEAIEDPGPFPVGWRDVTFEDTIFGEGTITGRIFYPSVIAGHMSNPDPSAGPYPLLAFQHGWLGHPSDYDDLCTHIASWGFVVASTGTETGIFPNIDQFARDTRSLLHWVDNESADSSSWLSGMAWDGDWAASGHSMGGGTLSLLIGYEPRVRTIIGLQSAAVGSPGTDNMQNFTGNAVQIAGEVDWVVPPAVVYGWYQEAIASRRDIFYMVQGMGHLGPTDTPPNWEPLPGSEQARLHRRLVTGILRAEVNGEEELYFDLLGEGLDPDPVIRQTNCLEPIIWTQESVSHPDTLAAGVAGYDGGLARMAWSPVPASISTPYGELGIDPETATIFYSASLPRKGWEEALLPVQPPWSGQTIYFQGIVLDGEGGGRLTRMVELPVP